MTTKDINEMYFALLLLGLNKKQAYKFIKSHSNKYIEYKVLKN